jgi:hypothetical protein
VKEANKIWGSPLFREPELFGKERMYGAMWHPRLRRRVHRRTELRIGEILGPKWRRSEAKIDGVLEESVAVTDTKLDAQRLQETFMGIEKDVDPEGQPSMEGNDEKPGHGA